MDPLVRHANDLFLVKIDSLDKKTKHQQTQQQLMSHPEHHVQNKRCKIEEMKKAHNGTWTCMVNTGYYGVYSDTINITTVRNNDVDVPMGVILGVSIPIGVLCLVLLVLLLIWCCCPVYLALCCCCIPACREKSEAASKSKTHYTQTEGRRRTSNEGVATQTGVPVVTQHSRRYFSHHKLNWHVL